uniref:GG14527 n=1 Tax=Drosophila erecta TaxID=7220 RepID=B3P005_DROER
MAAHSVPKALNRLTRIEWLWLWMWMWMWDAGARAGNKFERIEHAFSSHLFRGGFRAFCAELGRPVIPDLDFDLAREYERGSVGLFQADRQTGASEFLVFLLGETTELEKTAIPEIALIWYDKAGRAVTRLSSS